MYLSRIELDMTKRKTLYSLTNYEMIHAAVEKTFDTEERVLWRLDHTVDHDYLYMVSPQKGDLSIVEDQFGKTESAKSADYQTFLDNLMVGQKWHYRLTFNPTRSPFIGGNTERGKVVALIKDKDIIEWLIRRKGHIGLNLSEDNISITARRWGYPKKKSQKVRFYAVTVEGYAEVIDPEALRETLVEGLGRQKAYGCGLMTLAR